MFEQDENVMSESVIDLAGLSDNGQQTKIMHKFQAAFRQISDIIDYETQALSSHRTFLEKMDAGFSKNATKRESPDFDVIKARKARGLQTLVQIIDEMGQGGVDDAHKATIRELLHLLNDKLTRNQALLRTHMEAMSELVAMINSAAQERETDGTYDPFCLVANQQEKTMMGMGRID